MFDFLIYSRGHGCRCNRRVRCLGFEPIQAQCRHCRQLMVANVHNASDHLRLESTELGGFSNTRHSIDSDTYVAERMGRAIICAHYLA